MIAGDHMAIAVAIYCFKRNQIFISSVHQFRFQWHTKKNELYSRDSPSFVRRDCAFGVIFNNFEAGKDDASRLERLRIEEFFCLKLRPDPSKRTELVVYKSMLDRFKSDEKISFSVRTEKKTN